MASGWNLHQGEGEDRYLYRAVDSKEHQGFINSQTDAQAAKRFLTQDACSHTQEPRVINVDKNAAYPKAIDEMKASVELSRVWNYGKTSIWIISPLQDHRFIKRLRPGMGFHFQYSGREP